MKKFTILFLGLLCLFSTPTQASKKQDHPLFYSIVLTQRNNFTRHVVSFEKLITAVKKEDLEGLNRQGVMDNAMANAELIVSSSSSLDAIEFCHDNNLERLDEVDIQAIRDANALFGSASNIFQSYAQNVADWHQIFKDTSELEKALQKTQDGKAKLQEILDRVK